MTIYIGFGLTTKTPETKTPVTETETVTTTKDFFGSMMRSMTEELSAATKQHWEDHPPSTWKRIKKLFHI